MFSLTWVVFTPSLLLLLLGISHRRVADRCRRFWVSAVVWLAGLQCLLGLASLGLPLIPSLKAGSQSGFSGAPLDWWATEASLQLDLAAGVMLSLVSFIGWVVARYSDRYLSGDPHQGNYYRWIGVTVAAVCLMSAAGSLLLFAVCWSLASMGVHHLLLHYRDRRAAAAAAWTKFTFSRAGDFALLLALGLLYSQAGSSQLTLLNSESIRSVISSDASNLVAWLIVLAACLKSAQFPFHSWLPQTIETPTPVSALMHAGIVNAGGYLLIRLSSFLTMHSQVLVALTLVGTFTTLVGVIVMSTQSSIKRSLAYSTVAQMGFMMLQCGVGAFAAAFVHIVAHSLYKAHAFLSSGSAASERLQLHRQRLSERISLTRADRWLGNTYSWTAFALSAAIVLFFFMLSLQIFGINPAVKSGGWLLSLVICLALISGVWRALQSGNKPAFALSLIAAGVLSLTYTASYWIAESILSPPSIPASPALIGVNSIAALSFLGLFYWQNLLELPAGVKRPQRVWLNRLYAHAMHGFYVETIWQRLLRFSSVAPQNPLATLD